MKDFEYNLFQGLKIKPVGDNNYLLPEVDYVFPKHSYKEEFIPFESAFSEKIGLGGKLNSEGFRALRAFLADSDNVIITQMQNTRGCERFQIVADAPEDTTLSKGRSGKFPMKVWYYAPNALVLTFDKDGEVIPVAAFSFNTVGNIAYDVIQIQGVKGNSERRILHRLNQLGGWGVVLLSVIEEFAKARRIRQVWV